MTLDTSGLLDLSQARRTADDGRLIRRLLHAIRQALVDAEVSEHLGADPHERTGDRTGYHNPPATRP